MGLLYPFPATEGEVDRITKSKNSITLKTYGLPMIFWGYLLAYLTVVFAMVLAVRGPLSNMLSGEDAINRFIAFVVIATLILLPFVALCAFFYEKWLLKSGDKLSVIHRFFFIKVCKKTYTLDKDTPFVVDHFMDSPNVAKMQKNADLKAFENKGHFLLRAHLKDKKFILIDRHSRKADLVKIMELLKAH